MIVEPHAPDVSESKLFARLRTLGASKGDLLIVHASVLEAAATLTRLMHGNQSGNYHAYLDPLYGAFADLFSSLNSDLSTVEDAALECLSDALIEYVQPFMAHGRPEPTEKYCKQYGSFWVEASYPANMKRDLAAPIKECRARAIRAQVGRGAESARVGDAIGAMADGLVDHGATVPVAIATKRGAKPDYEGALRVAAVVIREAPDGDWLPRLEQIYDALDEEKIPAPKAWLKESCRCWSGHFDKAVVRKAITYRIDLANRRKIPAAEIPA